MARILITDDEAPMRALMNAALSARGHTVVEAKNARDALTVHTEAPADLIVTDLVMKDMDGIELLRRVDQGTQRVPVIAVSGNPHSKIWLNMAKMVGAECVLAKPFSCEEFVQAVELALARRGEV
jgi:CheY-like chemotaxis protein